MDPRKFTFLGQLDADASLMVIKAGGKFTKLEDMKGQNMSFGMLGTNTLVNLAVAEAVGAKPTLVSYESTPEGCLAVARGDLDTWIATADTVFKQTKTLEGKLKPVLLVGGRSAQLPDSIKTASELGLKLDESTGLCRVIIAGPANLEPGAKKALEDAIGKATRDSQFTETMKKAGYAAAPLGGDELQKAVSDVFKLIDKYEKLIPKGK